jgi:hypothetical protein
MLVDFWWTTQHHIPEDIILQAVLTPIHIIMLQVPVKIFWKLTLKREYLPFSSNGFCNVINLLLSFDENYHFISPFHSNFSQQFWQPKYKNIILSEFHNAMRIRFGQPSVFMEEERTSTLKMNCGIKTYLPSIYKQRIRNHKSAILLSIISTI